MDLWLQGDLLQLSRWEFFKYCLLLGNIWKLLSYMNGSEDVFHINSAFSDSVPNGRSGRGDGGFVPFPCIHQWGEGRGSSSLPWIHKWLHVVDQLRKSKNNSSTVAHPRLLALGSRFTEDNLGFNLLLSYFHCCTWSRSSSGHFAGGRHNQAARYRDVQTNPVEKRMLDQITSIYTYFKNGWPGAIVNTMTKRNCGPSKSSNTIKLLRYET